MRIEITPENGEVKCIVTTGDVVDIEATIEGHGHDLDTISYEIV